MRIALITILVVVIGLIGYGYYLKNIGNFDGEIVIGIGVLVVVTNSRKPPKRPMIKDKVPQPR